MLAKNQIKHAGFRLCYSKTMNFYYPFFRLICLIDFLAAKIYIAVQQGRIHMKLKLHWQILISILLGILLGFISRQFDFTDFISSYVAVLGTIFIRALRMIVVPLIIASIISGVTSMETVSGFGRMGIKTFTYYIFSTLFAIIAGLLLVNLIVPGEGLHMTAGALPEGIQTNVSQLGDTILGIIPTNPFQAMVQGKMLPTIFFSLLFGFFILKADNKYRVQLTDFFNAVFEVMMKMTHFIIRFTPIGVFALMAKIIAETGFEVFIPMFSYMLTVFGALMIHALITLPLLIYTFAGINPLAHLKAMSTALLTAFSLASSSATLPLTMESLEEKAGVSNRVTSFVAPLGATVNMDGTALYECVAAIFIAQVYGIELSLLQQIVVVITALLASIGAAGVPMAGLVMITIILNAVGLPLEGIGLILAVDRILDMIRSAVNVWSDSCGTVIIAKSEGENTLKVLMKASNT
jgi:Na+/H+-dicarboxylate symporter